MLDLFRARLSRRRYPVVPPKLPDFSIFGDARIVSLGHFRWLQEYDFHFDDCLGRAHFTRDDGRSLTARYYRSVVEPPVLNLGWPFQRAYLLWQEHFNYDIFWDSGQLKWELWPQLFIAEDSGNNWRWRGEDCFERYYVTLSLLRRDWAEKRTVFECSRPPSVDHLHTELERDWIQEVKRLIWG